MSEAANLANENQYRPASHVRSGKNLDLNRPDALMYAKKGVVLWESYYWLNDHLRGQQKKL